MERVSKCLRDVMTRSIPGPCWIRVHFIRALRGRFERLTRSVCVAYSGVGWRCLGLSGLLGVVCVTHFGVGLSGLLEDQFEHLLGCDTLTSGVYPFVDLWSGHPSARES